MSFLSRVYKRMAFSTHPFLSFTIPSSDLKPINQFKMFAFILAISTALFSSAFGQACAVDGNLQNQLTQITQAAQNQIQQLQYMTAAQSPLVAANYANAIAQQYNNLNTIMTAYQTAYRAYPYATACQYQGNPWLYYANGIYNGYTAQQQQMAQLQVLAAQGANAWNPSAAAGYATALQAQYTAMLNNAQAIGGAWGVRYWGRK